MEDHTQSKKNKLLVSESNPQNICFLQEIPQEILINVVSQLTDDPMSMFKFAQCCKSFYAQFVMTFQLESRSMRVTVDNLWKSAANQRCALSIGSGHYGPSIGSGELFEWFCQLLVCGNRNVLLLQETTETLNVNLNLIGGPESLVTEFKQHSNEWQLGIDIMRELGERGCNLPKCLPSYAMELMPGMVINRIDDMRPILYVQAIYPKIGQIKLINPLCLKEAIYLRRGELNVICTYKCREEGHVIDHVITAYNAFLAARPINYEQLNSPHVVHPILTYLAFARGNNLMA